MKGSRSEEQSSIRAHRAAPPLTQATVEAEGAGILNEIPGAPGVLLWGALRDVRLWTDTPQDLREEAFAPGGVELRRFELGEISGDTELHGALEILVGVADRSSGVRARDVLNSCRRIASWAAGIEARETQLAFAQAAALIRPRDPQLALEVGRSARDLAHYSQAESWFRRAIVAARRADDWSTYAWAYNGLAVLYLRTGNGPAARALFDRALRVARRRRLTAVRAVVHHHLFHLTTEAGLLHEAYEHVRAALEAYGTDNSNLHGLVSDVGRFWLHVGEPGRALPLFETAAPGISDRNVRAMVTANTARAAAAIGDIDRYESARQRTLQLLELTTSRCRLAETWATIAYADLSASMWSRAEWAAGEALSVAALTRETEVRLIAEEQVALARRKRSAEQQSPPSAETPGIARQGIRLAAELVAALQRETSR